MADIKISALPTATTPLTGAELVPIVQGGVTKQTTATAIFTTGILPVVNGGTGTATPALVPGTNVTITGTWPNQTINSTSSATVTNVSVVSANGLAGTVANPTTTPAITLSTSVTGVVKGNGTTFSAATAGTDYVAPGGALGTPSSGTVTNLTGTASININGTVGATTPATGTFTSLNTGQLAGLRNRIINGAMTIDQRNGGAAQTITAAAALAYTVDRFYAYSTGANVTGQQVAGSLQSQKRYRFTGAASVTAIGFGTRLEAVNTYDLNNKTVTISADIANSLLTTVTWTLFRATTTDDTFGTLAAPTVTSLGTGTFTVTSTVTNYNAQVTLPTAATTGLQLVFTVGAQTSGTWTIGNVQLELGSVATPFEQRPYGMEYSLCQRYYSKSYAPGTTPGTVTYTGSLTGASSYNTTYGSQFVTSFKLPVTMRANPTVTIYNPYNGNSGNIMQGGGGGNYAATVDYPSPEVVSFNANVTANTVLNDQYKYAWTASAEL